MHARLKCIQIQNQKYITLHRIAPNHTQLAIFKKNKQHTIMKKESCKTQQNTTETRSDNKEKNA